MPPTPLILVFSEAGQFMRSPEATRVAAVISIHGSYEFGLEATVPHRLDLSFDDAASPDNPDPVAAYHARQYLKSQQDFGRTLRPPTRDDVRQIVDFARKIQSVDGTLLIHCSGGISRSPAAALICLVTWSPAGNESQCWNVVRQLRPSAQPHPDLLRFADGLLNCDGRLAALAA